MELNLKTARKYYHIAIKELFNTFKAKNMTVPVFIFGKQRSGTTMVTYFLTITNNIKVYDERMNNSLFSNFRLKDFQVIDSTIEKSKYPFNAYKVITDSHLIQNFVNKYPNCRCLCRARKRND